MVSVYKTFVFSFFIKLNHERICFSLLFNFTAVGV